MLQWGILSGLFWNTSLWVPDPPPLSQTPLLIARGVGAPSFDDSSPRGLPGGRCTFWGGAVQGGEGG